MTREDAIVYGKRVIDLGLNDETQAFCELAIKALEQEPFMNKPCIANQVCHEDKVKVLDRIRAEIEFKSRIVLKDTPNDDWTVKWNECIKEVLEIIDKYRAESEVQE